MTAGVINSGCKFLPKSSGISPSVILVYATGVIEFVKTFLFCPSNLSVFIRPTIAIFAEP